MKTNTAIKSVPLPNCIHPPKAKLSNQNEIMTARTRLIVTTCLYLSPKESARSLSTLIAVDVKIDTPQKTKAGPIFTTSGTSIFVIKENTDTA